LNVVGLTWGLPARWHPDEKADTVARMLEERSLAPDSFINPSLPLYLTLPVVALQQGAASAGLLHGHAADPLLAGRLLAALAGAGAVVLLGRLAIACGLGLLPALLLAVSPGLVNLCHFATPEAWLVLGSVGTLLLAVRHLEGRSSAMALGLVLGLTASTKYTAAALAVPCLLAVWMREREPAGRRDRWALLAVCALSALAALLLLGPPGLALAGRLQLPDARMLPPEHARAFVAALGVLAATGAAVLAAVLALAWRDHPWSARLVRAEAVILGASAAAGFLLGTPYAVLRPLAFLSGLAFNQMTRHEYKGLVGASTSFLGYLGLARDALTAPFLCAVLLGLLVATGRTLNRDRRAPLFMTALLAPYLMVASGGHQALRFLAPALPAAALLGALGLTWLTDPRARKLAQALVVARALFASLLVARLFLVDSRIRATRWLEEQVPAGTAIDVITNHAGYVPQAPPGRPFRIVPTLSREMAPPARFVEAADRYPAEAAPWLVLTASFYTRFLEHPEQAPERAMFFRDLLGGRRGFAVAARFKQEGWRSYPAEFLDPEIVVLKKKGF
jgi:hypothetical protein